MTWHWAHTLWFGYAWPSDKGNGPEAIQQTVIYAAILAVLVPAARNFMKREFHKLHLKAESHRDEHAKAISRLEAKLDRIMSKGDDPDASV